MNWRDELDLKVMYRRKFSIFPREIDGKRIFMKAYYSKYNCWSSSNGRAQSHIDFVENITEEEYVMRKLSGA